MSHAVVCGRVDGRRFFVVAGFGPQDMAVFIFLPKSKKKPASVFLFGGNPMTYDAGIPPNSRTFSMRLIKTQRTGVSRATGRLIY
jgi:hypothetical protein